MIAIYTWITILKTFDISQIPFIEDKIIKGLKEYGFEVEPINKEGKVSVFNNEKNPSFVMAINLLSQKEYNVNELFSIVEHICNFNKIKVYSIVINRITDTDVKMIWSGSNILIDKEKQKSNLN